MTITTEETFDEQVKDMFANEQLVKEKVVETTDTDEKVNDVEDNKNVEDLSKSEDSKQELGEKLENNSNEDKEVISQFFSVLGVEKEITDFSIDGLAKATKEIIDEKDAKLQEYESDEELKQFAEWKKQGGTIETFKSIPQRIEYSKIEIADDNIDLQEQITRAVLKVVRNLDDEEIEEEVERLKDTGKLLNFSKNGLPKLDKLNEQQVNSYKESEKLKAESEQEKVNNVWKDVTTTLEKGVINDFVLPQNDLKEFKSYVLPDNNGISKAIEKRNSLTIDQQLLLDFIIMKDFKIAGLDKVKNQIKDNGGTRNVSKLFGSSGNQNTQKEKELSSDALAKINSDFKNNN